jgi:predicted ATPase/class 3 adenylate cyclase
MVCRDLTFLFSDIEGSTARWEAHREAMQRALARHDDLMRAAIEGHGGRVFKTVGDAFCAIFPNGADAVTAAIEAQQRLRAQDWSDVEGLRVRMALHTGDAQEREGDYFGPTVNRVARILSAGHGEQILLSDVAAAAVAQALPDGVALRDLGSHRLKDLAAPLTIFQLVARGLREEFPQLRSLDANPTNVPAQLTSFVGRDEESADIERLLGEARLVTVTGPGGVGKTRVALHVATALRERFADGVWFVDLAPLAQGELVAATIAAAFNVEAVGARPAIDELVAALRAKKTLVVLDNCEHVIAGAAAAMETILQQCAGVRAIATSREALGVAGERVYQLPSLAEGPGVELFADRARAVQPRFELSGTNRASVSAIVTRLDGIPFAIELAASRVKLISLERLERGLDERFKLLTGGSRTALPRQQTLRAMIGWSYDLLSDAERSTLDCLGIFRGGWTLEAAEAICVDERFGDADALTLLGSLVEKSLVVAEERESDVRYRLLESTREFARERLKETGALDDVSARHCRFFLAESSRQWARFWHTNSKEWHPSVRAEFDNYRAAIDWGLVENHDTVAGAQIICNLRFAHFPQERELVSAAMKGIDLLPDSCRAALQISAAHYEMDRGGPSLQLAMSAAKAAQLARDYAMLAEANVYIGHTHYRAGEIADAVSYGEKALEAARKVDSPFLTASICESLGLWTGFAGDRERGRHLLREAVETLRAAGDVPRLTGILNDLAEAEFADGDVDGAIACMRESIQLTPDEEIHLSFRVLRRLNFTGYLLANGDLSEAYPNAIESIKGTVEIGNPIEIGIAHANVARFAALGGDAQTSARLIGFSDAIYDRMGAVREIGEQIGYEATMDLLRSALEPERLAALLAEGRELTQEQAVAMASSVAPPYNDLSHAASDRNDHLSF